MSGKKKQGEKTGDTKNDEETKAAPALTPLPPLEAVAQHLERLLSDQVLDFYTNPVKVVRRWLGSSSGAASKAQASDIVNAATKLLDPHGISAEGRALLLTTAMQQESAMDISEQGGENEGANIAESIYLTIASSREIETWLISLAARLLWKDGKFTESFEMSQKGITIINQHIEAHATPSLFPLLARMYRLLSLAAESMQSSPALEVALRIGIAKAHNLATLRRDVDTQATLLNGMLRDLLRHSQIEQAQKLLANCTFPESASNNQLCRYLYYSGRIQALRLEYTSSFSNLSQCLRKAPTTTGTGFRIAAQRLLIVVQLLMGEIPERHVFFQSGMKQELQPYLSITQAVRRGDLAVFEQEVTQHSDRLQLDQTRTLISRLAHQVVKAGLRNLNVSYSRLSLQDVADRLGLPSAKSAEYVVAKAVRDGVLDATIHHKEGYVQSHDLIDVYATKEPAEAFHRRIAYCLTVHNDAVRGMRYPPDEYKRQLEASRGMRRKRMGDKTDEEEAKELEDEFDEDY